MDKSTALRQFLFLGAREYVIELYQKGRISLSKATELLEVSTFDIMRLVKEKGYTGPMSMAVKNSPNSAG